MGETLGERRAALGEKKKHENTQHDAGTGSKALDQGSGHISKQASTRWRKLGPGRDYSSRVCGRGADLQATFCVRLRSQARIPSKTAGGPTNSTLKFNV